MARARQPGRRSHSPAQAHVLIVENSRTLAAAVASRCQAMGHVIAEVASSYRDAKALLAEHPERFLAAVVGLVLPDATDGEIVELVRQYKVPTIVLTGTDDVSLRDDLFHRGAADYVTKSGPTGVEYVVRMVERLADTRSKKVLIVDDSKSFRNHMSNLLRQHGYDTVTAGDGLEGLQVMKECADISLILTDYHMPNMDGLEMTATLRRTHPYDRLVILAASDSENPDLIVRFLKNGATDYYRKSASIEELFCRVDLNMDVLRQLEKTREAAYKDFLTSLPNRRAFFESGAKIHQQALRHDTELMLCMMDIDFFKSINDTHGHDAGDAALVEVGQVLQRYAQDFHAEIARLGGEEFVCMLTGPFADHAAQLEELRAAIEAIECVYAGQPVPITVSIGATTVMGTSIDEMVNEADSWLYDAKRSGRNCVVFEGELLPRDDGARELSDMMVAQRSRPASPVLH